MNDLQSQIDKIIANIIDIIAQCRGQFELSSLIKEMVEVTDNIKYIKEIIRDQLESDCLVSFYDRYTIFANNKTREIKELGALIGGEKKGGYFIYRKNKKETEDKKQKKQEELSMLKEYIEEVITDQNEINEDTRIQLELINKELAELKVNKPKLDKQHNPIGFIVPQYDKEKKD